MKNILFAICIILSINSLKAQPGGGCDCNEDEENICSTPTPCDVAYGCCVPVEQTNVPINNNLSWLVVGGVLIGLFYFRKQYIKT